MRAIPTGIVRRIPAAAASATLGLLTMWLILWAPFSSPKKPSERWILELNARTPTECVVKFSFDLGHGYPPIRLERDTFLPLQSGDTFQRLAFPLPPGRLRTVKVSISNAPMIDVESASIREPDGKIISNQLPRAFIAAEGAQAVINDRFTRLTAPSGSRQIQFEIAYPTSIYIERGDEPSAISAIALFILIAWGTWVLIRRFEDGDWNERMLNGISTVNKAAHRHPFRALFFVSILSVSINSYPIAFCGKSLVSTNTGPQLYHLFPPTMPGTQAEDAEAVNGSDVTAMALAHMPYAAIERRALFRDHEFPLWNRYNNCGLPLLGQGQSMMGDPLHLLLLAMGASWQAWNVKFLLAKLIFVFGVGCLTWLCTRRIGVSLLLSASATWIGFFPFRYNHAAVFSVCYGPWLLLPWIGISRAKRGRQAAAWALMLIVADFAELCSGTAKESSMLLLCINATGLILAATSRESFALRRRRILILAGASAVFLLLSAPFWLTFFDVLRHALTSYDEPYAIRLPFSMAVSLFDDIFIQEVSDNFAHSIPSVNFLILSGVILVFVHWRKAIQDRIALSLLMFTAGIGLLVFPIIPTKWILQTSFLGNIYHVSNTFGCSLLILLPILAGKGFQFHLEETRLGNRSRLLLLHAGLLLSLIAPIALMFLRQSNAHSPSLGDDFFLPYAIAIVSAALLLPWSMAWSVHQPRLRMAGAICVATCFFAIHFRNGMYGTTKIDDYVMNPKSGFNLTARAPSITALRDQMTQPWRVSGLNSTLGPGYSGVIDFEGINAPDALMNPYYRQLCEAAGFSFESFWKIVFHAPELSLTKSITDSMNCRFFLHERGTAPPVQGVLFQLGSYDLDLYESKTAWPRAFFTDGIITGDGASDYVAALTSSDGRPFAFAQKELSLPMGETMAKRHISPATEYVLTNNTTAFKISAPTPGVAVLLETYEEGNFRVRLDGKETSYVRLNQAFKGVLIDTPGVHHIEFVYFPRILLPAFIVAGLGLILGIAGTTILSCGRWRFDLQDADAHAAMDAKAA